jgi:hypothetical protein
MKYEYPSINAYFEQVGSPHRPEKVYQKAFDYDQTPLETLTNFKIGMERSEVLNWALSEYNLDLEYVRPLQEDLMLYWLPLCMEYWQKSLFEKFNYYFVWRFHEALHYSQNIIAQTIGKEIQSLTYRFMRDSILARISEEKYLSFSKQKTSSHFWIETLISYGSFADNIGELLQIWSKMDNFGFAISYFQYVSCLIYEWDINPLFIPPCTGGGAPYLFDPVIEWNKHNVESLEKWLEIKNIQHLISKAKAQIQNEDQIEIVSKLESAFLNDQDAVEYRVLELLDNLSPLTC